MADILICPAGNADNDLTGCIVIDDQTVPGSVNWQTTLGLAAGSYEARRLGTPVTFALALPATAPAQFATGGWSVATGSGPSQVDITVSTLPANNGSALTDVQFDVGSSGVWMSVGGATTGTYTVTATGGPGTSQDIRLRAVNAAGTGTPSAVKSVTTGAAASVATVTASGNDEINFAQPVGYAARKYVMWYKGSPTTADFHNLINIQGGGGTRLIRTSTNQIRIALNGTNAITSTALATATDNMAIVMYDLNASSPQQIQLSASADGSAWEDSQQSAGASAVTQNVDISLVGDHVGGLKFIGLAVSDSVTAGLPDLATFKTHLGNDAAADIASLISGAGMDMVFHAYGNAAAWNAPTGFQSAFTLSTTSTPSFT